MNKNLKKKIVMGVCTAAFMSQTVLAFAGTTPQSAQVSNVAMTSEQQAFANRLSDNAKECFMQMNNDDRAMCMKIANHGCKGKNDCKGQGGCKSDMNSCKGKNACKGQGSCKVAVNDAVTICKNKREAA